MYDEKDGLLPARAQDTCSKEKECKGLQTPRIVEQAQLARVLTCQEL